MGESCDWSHRNARDHAHAGAQFGYKANATGPVALERFANKTNKVGWNGLPFGVKLLIQKCSRHRKDGAPIDLGPWWA
jgi:hypothetical protein